MTVDSVERMDKIKLPPLTLNMLTKSQLCDLIPQLIKTVTGTGPPQFTEELRPSWWPDDIPWAALASMLQLPSCEVSSTELRRIVRCCYYHSGNEKLLSSSEDGVSEIPTVTPKACGRLDISLEMPTASSTCAAVGEAVLAPTVGLVSPHCVPNNFSGHFTRGQRQMFNAYLRKKQQVQAEKVETRKLPLWDDSKHPVNAWWVKKHARRAPPEPHPSKTLKQEDFFSACGLTDLNALRLKHEAEENHDSVDLDCQIIAVEGPLSASSVTSPRTPKSLMSQLSRDSAAVARKRIRFSAKDEEGSGNDSESNTATSGVKQGALLNIDFSSLLGQRLKKHMQAETTVPVIKNPEEYCKTTRAQSDVGVKLRHRASEYPVTFRKKKAVHHRHCHTFKLTGGERREFLRVLKTGLDKTSRRLQRQMKSCFVQLVKLTRQEIRYWTIKRTTIINQEIHIDDDISIMQVDIPESSYRAVCHKLPVASADGVCLYGDGIYEHKYGPASYTFQGLGAHDRLRSDPSATRPPSFLYADRSPSPPRPQFLVKKVNKNFNGQETQRLVYVPLNDAGLQEPRCLPSQPGTTMQPPKKPVKTASSARKSTIPLYRRLGPKSRRKQLVAQMGGLQGSDSEFTIESTSSDEELGSQKKQQQQQQKQQHVDGKQARPVAAVESSGKPVHLLDAQPDCPAVVPHTLHVAHPAPEHVGIVENSASTFLPQMFPITEVTLLPGQDPSILTEHQSRSVAAPHSVPSSIQSAFPGLAKQLQAANDSSAPLALRVATGAHQQKFQILSDGASTVCGQASSDQVAQEPQRNDGELTLSIGAVYSASDLRNQQLVSALGLQWVSTSPPETVAPTQTAVQPPNFLLSPAAPVLPPQQLQPPPQQPVPSQQLQEVTQRSQPSVRTTYQPRILQSSQRQQPRTSRYLPTSQPRSQTVQRLGVPAPHPAAGSHSRLSGIFTPIRQSRPPPVRPSEPQNSSRPVARAARPTENHCSAEGAACVKTRPIPVELPPVPPPLIKRTPSVHKPPQGQIRGSSRPPSAWHVVNAVDDDVVEVICIDD